VTPAGGRSSRRSGDIFAQLRSWPRRQNSGPVFDSSAGFKLSDGSLRSPDAAWIRKERWDALTDEEPEAFPPLCPDAVFEVRSRTDSIEELRAKLRTYVENGARLAVQVDPYERGVEVLRREGAARPSYDVVDLNEDLPGFELDLRSLD
jgi:Uma2 family endonuclease